MGRTPPRPTTFSRFRFDYTPLRRRRRELDLSQAALAASVGVSRVTINRIERGRVYPSKHLSTSIARAMGVPEHELYTVHDLE